MDKFSKNGQVLPIEQAVHSVLSVEFTYGFGVYESIRVKQRSPRFVAQHIDRLLASAKTIRLGHELDTKSISEAVQGLIDAIDKDTYNLKVLLIGGRTDKDSTLYILPLNPSFPDRKQYRVGATAITIDYERYLPDVKSLNMLPSYLAYRDAKEQGAYDALLVNRHGDITEGTRTNFFALDGMTIITPPLEHALEGVTRQNVMKVAKDNGFGLVEQPIKAGDLDTNLSYFITSTSTKIMPLRMIDKQELIISDDLRRLMALFNKFLADN